jgi:hypothetical protein
MLTARSTSFPKWNIKELLLHWNAFETMRNVCRNSYQKFRFEKHKTILKIERVSFFQSSKSKRRYQIENEIVVRSFQYFVLLKKSLLEVTGCV